MNWKWFIGSRVNSAMHWTVSRSVFPLTRYLPRGWSSLYDVQRFSGTKRLGVAFDIGANVGQTVGGLLLYFPRASIYCFEPVSSSFGKLASLCAPFQNVKCVQKALGSSAGTGVIQLHRNSELNTLVNAGPRRDDLEGITETVSIDTVDSFCAARWRADTRRRDARVLPRVCVLGPRARNRSLTGLRRARIQRLETVAHRTVRGSGQRRVDAGHGEAWISMVR